MRDSVFGQHLNDFIALERVRPWANLIDFNHLMTMLAMLLLSVIKVGLMAQDIMFFTFNGQNTTNSSYLVFDSMEIITHSPRLLALFTICYLGRANYIYEKDTLCAVQYSVLKQFPAFIAIMSTADWLIRRQLVLTLDDCIFVMLYIVVRHIDSQLPQEDHIPSFFKIKVKTNEDN